MKQIADSSLDSTLVMLEVGSHGFLSLQSFNMIKFECSRKQWEAFLVDVAQTEAMVPTRYGQPEIGLTLNLLLKTHHIPY